MIFNLRTLTKRMIKNILTKILIFIVWIFEDLERRKGSFSDLTRPVYCGTAVLKINLKKPRFPSFKSWATKPMNLVALINPLLPIMNPHTIKCMLG